MMDFITYRGVEYLLDPRYNHHEKNKPLLYTCVSGTEKAQAYFEWLTTNPNIILEVFSATAHVTNYRNYYILQTVGKPYQPTIQPTISERRAILNIQVDNIELAKLEDVTAAIALLKKLRLLHH